MLPNQGPHLDQVRTGSDRAHQVITCPTCQKTLLERSVSAHSASQNAPESPTSTSPVIKISQQT
eukprot:3107495-Prorocentrum_lima.AAC.1